MDMSKFIIAKSDQLNSDDLMGGPITVTITSVRGTDASDQPVAVHFDGDDGKPFKPCKSMRRVMVGVWGPDASKYAGQSMTLYREPEVQFGGMKVGGIRISHMSGLTEKKTMALTATRGKKGLHTVMPLAGGAPEPKAEDAAAKWATAYIGKLATFGTIEAVQAFAGQKAPKLTELETARPDLHQQVTEALAKRTAELQPAAAGAFTDDDLTGESGGNAKIASDWRSAIAGAKTADEAKDAYARSELDRSMIDDTLSQSIDDTFAETMERFRVEADA